MQPEAVRLYIYEAIAVLFIMHILIFDIGRKIFIIVASFFALATVAIGGWHILVTYLAFGGIFIYCYHEIKLGYLSSLFMGFVGYWILRFAVTSALLWLQ
jgi:hypothetical protein